MAHSIHFQTTSQMDTSPSPPSVSVASSKSSSKSPTPGPFSALFAPLDRDSGIEGMEGVEEGARFKQERQQPPPPSAGNKVTATVLSSLQNMFRVRIAEGGDKLLVPSDFLELPTTFEMRQEEEDAEAIDFEELVSDILTEVMTLMAGGTKQRRSPTLYSYADAHCTTLQSFVFKEPTRLAWPKRTWFAWLIACLTTCCRPTKESIPKRGT